MKKILLLVVAAWSLLPAAAQSHENFPSRVEVTGQADREVTPDEFYLSITLAERDSKGKVTLEEQQRAMNAALRKAGVDVDKQLTRTDLTSAFFKRRTALATATFELKLSSPAEVAKVWTALDALAVSELTLARVSHSEIERLREEVRIEAMRNARERARTLAEAIGQQIGKCFYISDYSGNSLPTVYNAAPLARAMKAADGVAEEEGAFDDLAYQKIRLDYRLTAHFVLE